MASMPASRSPADPGQLLAELRGQTAVMVDQLAALVGVETPSSDLAACAAGAEIVRQIAASVVGDPGELIVAAGRTHLRWRWAAAGEPVIALIGHVDTVWPVRHPGTVAIQR